MKFHGTNLILVFIFLTFYDLTLQNMNYRNTMEINTQEFQLAIFDQCFTNPFDTRVIIANWSNYNQEYLSVSNLKAMMIFGIEKTDNLEMYKTKPQRYLVYADETILSTKPLPVKTIIIDGFDIKSFQLILHKLKNSQLWNIHGFFLVKNTQTLDSCKYADLFLKAIWNFNILSVIFLCNDLNFGINLYTFNPYSKNSSKFWKIFSIYKQENDQLITLFVNAYYSVNTSLMCEEIWFDKTEDLSEYPVRIALSNLTYDSIIDESSRKLIQIEAYKTGRLYMSIIWKKLKARLYTPVYFVEEDFGEINNDGIATGIIGDVLRGKYEALGSEDYQRGLWKLEVNTFLRSGLCFIIKKVNISISAQLMKAFPLRIQMELLIIFIMISVLFSYILRVSYSTAVMDVLRAIFGVSMIKKPRFQFGRDIIIWFIFIFMILNTYLQSQLSAMLVTASLYRNQQADVFDLLKMGYDVYFNRVLAEAYRQSPLENDTDHYFDNVLECIVLMNINDTIACIEDCTLIEYAMQKTEELEILYNKDYDRNDVLIMRDESPLHNRVEEIYVRLFEHGIIWYINDLDKLYYKKSALAKIPQLSLRRLKYSFYILVIGYTFSICVFFFEVGKFSIKHLYFNI